MIMSLRSKTSASTCSMANESNLGPLGGHDDREGLPQQPDWHVENGLVVYTAAFHLKRGYCCGSGCRHCPYEPRHSEGTTEVRS
jgi:hypothetical protein